MLRSMEPAKMFNKSKIQVKIFLCVELANVDYSLALFHWQSIIVLFGLDSKV